MIHIREAKEADASTLGALVERSKGHWKYPVDLMETWREQGLFNITTEMCKSGELRVAEDMDSRSILGFYRLRQAIDEAILEDLWVDDTYIGSGLHVGETLLKHAFDGARKVGQHSLSLWADPHAVGFYERYGLHVVGETEPNPETGRSLPIMRIEFAD